MIGKVLLFIGYIACCVAAWFLFAGMWRNKYDIDSTDAKFFTAMSLAGPISLGAAGLLWVVDINGEEPSKIVWRKKAA